MLFCNEYQLESPIKKETPFVTHFESLGPFDSSKRSLRQFDLTKRMFRYPCSFLIYSRSFDSLPQPVLDRISVRLNEVLSGVDQSRTFSHLSETDRESLKAILIETKPKLTANW